VFGIERFTCDLVISLCGGCGLLVLVHALVAPANPERLVETLLVDVFSALLIGVAGAAAYMRGVKTYRRFAFFLRKGMVVGLLVSGILAAC